MGITSGPRELPMVLAVHASMFWALTELLGLDAPVGLVMGGVVGTAAVWWQQWGGAEHRTRAPRPATGRRSGSAAGGCSASPSGWGCTSSLR